MDKQLLGNILKKYKLKATPARLALLRVFHEHQKPLNIQNLYKKLANLGVDQATVYRNAEILEKVGLLKKVFIDDNKAYYELNFGDHHHHLICGNCQEIEDIEINDHNWISKILKSRKFLMTNHSFEFFGLCERCLKIN